MLYKYTIHSDICQEFFQKKENYFLKLRILMPIKAKEA